MAEVVEVEAVVVAVVVAEVVELTSVSESLQEAV